LSQPSIESEKIQVRRHIKQKVSTKSFPENNIMRQLTLPVLLSLLLSVLVCNKRVACGFSLHGASQLCQLGKDKRGSTTFQNQRSSPLLIFSNTESDDDNNRGIALEDSPKQQQQQQQSTLLKEQQSEYLAEARDPFSLIRIGIWSLLGLVGLVGTVTSVTGASAEASRGWQNVQNTLINLVVTLAMAGALVLEFKLGTKGKEIVTKELENPMLKGNSGFYVDTKTNIQPSTAGDEDQDDTQ
jgi:hypothetical protein